MYTKDKTITASNLSKNFSNDLSKVKTKAYETRDALADVAHHAKSGATTYLKSSLQGFKNDTADLQESVITYIQANPVKSVLWGVFAGFIFSKLSK